jgi:DNA mismatch repair protein MutL
MKKIQLLPQEVINFISAGEIVERPASIVKELLENSLDSGASIINLKIKNQNEAMEITVEDNGGGINPEDLPIIFMEHSTSKINTINDVINVGTLGFRGEALWSISNVSKVKIKSYNNEIYEINSEYGNVSPVKILGNTYTQGTTIEVTHIFDNIPVRKKFLKEFNTEYNQGVKIFNEESFCFPHVGFNLYLNNEIVQSYSMGNPLMRIEEITKNSLWPIINHFTYNDYHGKLILSYEKKGKFFISLNNRPIEDYKIKNYIKNQIEKQLNKTIYGITGGLYLEIPQEDIDVNIHPRKQEVKFKDSHTLYELLRNLVIFNAPILDPPMMNNNFKSNFSLPKFNNFKELLTINAVNDNIKNHEIIHIFNNRFLIFKKEKKIIMVHLDKINNKKEKPLTTKIITLNPELLSLSNNWFQYNIKFSIVSENSIIAWEIPGDFPGTMEEFFQELKKQWEDNNLNLWLGQFNPWCVENIIEYLEHNPLDGDWPLAYCSWIISLDE